jgi:signal transduction histidine kinase
MLTTPIVTSLLTFSLLACGFAFLRGGVGERVGAGVILANLVLTLANEYLQQNQVVTLAIDGLTALALLAIAVRFASFWLGGVMLLYALQFSMHAFYFVAARPRDLIHAVVNNLDFFAVSLCLVVGTTVAWRQQRKTPSDPNLR